MTMVAERSGRALRGGPPGRHLEPAQPPSLPGPRGGGEGAPAARRSRLRDDRLFGDVLALKRWLERRRQR